MATYCFKCNYCRSTKETGYRMADCSNCGAEMVRDYKAESVAVNRDNIRAVKEGGKTNG